MCVEGVGGCFFDWFGFLVFSGVGGGKVVSICWRRIALRKYLKHGTGKFSKTMSVPFLPPGLSIQASQALDYPSILMVVVAPSPFRLIRTLNH